MSSLSESIATSMATLLSITLSATATATATSSIAAFDPSTPSSISPLPLTIQLRSNIQGTSDFYPFDDIVALNQNSDRDFSFKELFASGCEVNGVADCTRACNNTETFFGSLETFYNCVALASVAYWTQDAKTLYVSNETEFNASSIMGSGTLAEFDGRQVLKSFISCAKDSCDHDGLSEPCNKTIDALSIETSTAKEIFDAMDHFCPDLAAEINPDIFGPGVLISYVLQVCFSAMLYLLLKGFTLWVRITQGSQPKPRPKPPKPYNLKRSMTRIESMIWKDSSAMSRTSIAIATTLVEFQEAQCWFVFAVQIASILAIVVNSQEGTFWGEIIVNAAVAFHVSQNGVLPMFLIQVCLHHEGIRNFHTFLGFLMEYVLALVATTQKIYFKDAFNLFKEQNQIKQCGYNPSPRTYCAATRSLDGMQLSFFPHPLLYKMVFLVLDTIAIVMLILDQVAWVLRQHRRTKDIQIGKYRVGRWPDGKMKRHGLRVKRWIWRVLEVSYLVVNILYMVSLIKVITAESFAANRWSYGQIIAVTVWGPVIVKFSDLLLSGPPKNGPRLETGPPRLRIDNIINGRMGTSADEELLTDDDEVFYDAETAEARGAVLQDEITLQSEVGTETPDKGGLTRRGKDRDDQA